MSYGSHTGQGVNPRSTASCRLTGDRGSPHTSQASRWKTVASGVTQTGGSETVPTLTHKPLSPGSVMDSANPTSF